MKRPSAVALFLVVSSSARCQGTFQNLDFEAANVRDLPPTSPGESVAITDGVPAWAISPSIAGTSMGHNSLTLGGADVEIYGPQWRTDQILQGKYTVGLFQSFVGPPTEASIWQSGQIPVGTESVMFYGAGSFGVFFAGQQLPLATLTSGTKYAVYGADISAFAGQTGELRFVGNGLLDNISFSSTAVPEPSALGLLALGMVALGLTRRERVG